MSYSMKNALVTDSDRTRVLNMEEILQGVLASTQDALQVKPTASGTAGVPGADVQSVQGVETGIPVRVKGGLTIVPVAFTRPSTTPTYAAGTVVGTSPAANLAFAGAGRVVGGTGYITKARLMKNNTVVANAVFRLYLFNVAPTAIADNTAFTLLYAAANSIIEAIDFFSQVTEGAGSTGSKGGGSLPNGPIPYACAAADTQLYGVLVAEAAYAGTSSEAFTVELTFDQN